MRCIICNQEFSIKRRNLGYRICLNCGEAKARVELERRKKCIAPAYNKGAYQYIGTKKDALDVGK